MYCIYTLSDIIISHSWHIGLLPPTHRTTH